MIFTFLVALRLLVVNCEKTDVTDFFRVDQKWERINRRFELYKVYNDLEIVDKIFLNGLFTSIKNIDLNYDDAQENVNRNLKFETIADNLNGTRRYLRGLSKDVDRSFVNALGLNARSRKKRMIFELGKFDFKYETLPSGRYFLSSRPREPDSICYDRGHLLLLSPKDERWKYEYSIVKTEVLQLMGSILDVLRIEKAVSPCLLKRYNVKKRKIQNETKLTNEIMLFTSMVTPRKAAVYGFSDYLNLGGSYTGYYFAKHISNFRCYETNRVKICKLLLCRVLLGRIYNVTASFRSFHHTPPGYNSLETEILSIPYHIIFKGDQIYPEYVITFTVHRAANGGVDELNEDK